MKRKISFVLIILMLVCSFGLFGCDSFNPIIGRWGDESYYLEFKRDNTVIDSEYIEYNAITISWSYDRETAIYEVIYKWSGQTTKIDYYVLEEGTLYVTDSYGTKHDLFYEKV